ncbi:MAG: peptidoglycan-binding protein, partial [Candidatus Phaeomarinobacter sp.]
KRDAELMVDLLDTRDRVAIDEYADRINVQWPSSPDENAREIHRRIDSLTSRGSTNLTGGMMRGVDEVLDHFDRSELNRVVLLSDGLANQGITDPYDIARQVRGARRDGVRISTIGLGLDYDENLMQAIAENGAGNYHYVEHPSQLARIFEEELSTLVRTTARDIRLRIKGGGAIENIDVISVEADTPDDVSVGDMFAGEAQRMMLRVEVAATDAASMSLGDLEVTYTDARSGDDASIEVPLTLKTSSDYDAIKQARNEDVVIEAALFDAERTQLQAVAAYEAGDTQRADGLLADLATRVETQAADMDDGRLSAKLEALSVEREQMSVAAAPSERSAYLKSSKQRLYQAKSGKRSGYQLKVGDEGLEVERLQTALADKGFWSGPIDGKYTDDLEGAVDEFQAAEGIKQDGVAGPSTLQNLGLY